MIFLWIGHLDPLIAETLHVAVTSSFESTFTKLSPIFEKKTGITLHGSYASSGVLATQILHGAPFDVFLSADQSHIIQLEKAGVAMPVDRLTYAYGELVLVMTEHTTASPPTALLRHSKIKHIAIANPVFAPYGVAAIQVLKRLAIFKILKPKLVWGESVGQVASFLMSGGVEAGFIAGSQWMILHQQQPALFVWKIPHHLYDPIQHCATRVKYSPSAKIAKLFLVFLKTKRAQRIIQAEGYQAI